MIRSSSFMARFSSRLSTMKTTTQGNTLSNIKPVFTRIYSLLCPAAELSHSPTMAPPMHYVALTCRPENSALAAEGIFTIR